jgi:hypothetical protein
VVIDQKAALGLFSNIDFEIISDITKKNQSSNKTNDVIEQ